MLNLKSDKMFYSGYQNNYQGYGEDDQNMVTESQYSQNYQQPSSQYYAPHQNDKTSASSKLGFLNSIPSSITVTKEKVRIPSPVKNQDDNNDDDFFNVHLTYDEMGMEDVTVEGNKKLFIKTIHDELLNFLKTYGVPLKSVCFHILNKSNDKELKEFFSRKEWDCLRREEKLLYHHLNDWVSEPVMSRVLNLINIETDAARIETLTKIYNSLAPQHSTSGAPASPPPPSPEVQEIPQDTENVSDNNQGESDMELLTKLQANVAPGPPRTKTTEEERRAVKEWGLRNPNADANQRKELAASLGLTKLTVDRLVVYANKKDSSRLGNFSLVENVKPNGKATLLISQRTKVDQNKMDNVRSLVKKINDQNSTNPQTSQLPSKNITDAIKNAVKSGNLKGVDFKKPLKIVVMPPKDNAKAQPSPTPQQQQPQQNNLINNAALASKAQNNKFNEVALTSYFKNKPFPTEEEINYFVECTRVPLDVTKNYVEKLQELYKENVKNESAETFQKDQHSQENLQQQDYSQGVQEQQPLSEHQQQLYPGQNHQYSEVDQQYSQVDRQYSQDDHQNAQLGHQYYSGDYHQQPQSDHQYPHDLENHQYSQNLHQYQDEPPLNESYPHDDLNQARYPDNYQTSAQPSYGSDDHQSHTAFTHQQAPSSGSQHGNSLIPELSLNQKRMFQDFIQRNPNPEMPDIVGFAEKIGMAFENVLLTLEMDFNVFNNSPSQEMQDEKALLFASLDPEVSQLLHDIQEFKGDKFSPVLEQELKSMFGNKIFCTVDNVKSFALAKNLNFASIYKKLNSNNDSVMLVSDETCKRLLDAATVNTSPGFSETDSIKKESPAQDANNWMTSSELNFETLQSETEGEYVEYEERSPKRKFEDQDFPENKKIKLEQPPTDDSGYGVSDVSQTEDSFHVKPDDSEEDILGDLITENIGEVNMLNDSLELFNDSISNVDLVNDLFQKVESQNSQSLTPKPVSDIEYGNILASLENTEHRPEPEISLKKKVKSGDLRKLFRGPIQNFSPALQVVSIKPSFKPYVFEVKLSDGLETSDNFYFKSGAADLKLNLVIKLMAVRYVGSKICVDSYELVEHRDSVIGAPLPIENDFFENLRATRIDPLDECDLTAPTTILDYISLQENLISFIEHSRFNLEELKENGSIETKKEILYKLLSSWDGKPSSKSLKILSRFLHMNNSDIQSFLTKIPPSVSSVSAEHSYCNMYKTLHQ